jgi:hypothetical protein
MNELLDQLRGIAARMPCSSDYPGAPECGTTSCDKMRLEAIISALEADGTISWLRPFQNRVSPYDAIQEL